jgi:hypothetical protein
MRILILLVFKIIFFVTIFIIISLNLPANPISGEITFGGAEDKCCGDILPDPCCTSVGGQICTITRSACRRGDYCGGSCLICPGGPGIESCQPCHYFITRCADENNEVCYSP